MHSQTFLYEFYVILSYSTSYNNYLLHTLPWGVDLEITRLTLVSVFQDPQINANLVKAFQEGGTAFAKALTLPSSFQTSTSLILNRDSEKLRLR